MAKPLSRANSAMGTTSQDAVNVQVILRCRPPSKEEVAARTPQVVKCNEALREVTLTQTVQGKQFGRTYHFDKVFPGDTSQEKLYVSAVSSIVEEVLDGFSCTIFAYGQTGTGKTHTMTGDIGGEDSELSPGAGVIPRAIHQIFTYLEGLGSEYTVKCSYLELYNEEITDLLAVGADTPKVRMMEDRNGVVLAGIEESIVRDSKEIFALLEQGSAKRRTAETLLNKQSSRSHSVFVVTVSVREITPEGDELIRVGKLYLVDLAGSENITRSGAVDQRAKEAGNINKSLLTLGRVITALVEGQGHVPYRDSKLTRLLRDSLGGKTKTCIIATIAPTVQCQEETLSTLDYAHRAKNIKNKPEINAKISKTTHLKEMNVEIEKLKSMLLATREKNGVYIPSKQYEEECEERRTLRTRVEELEAEAEAVAAQHELDKQEWEGRMAEQAAGYERQLSEVRGQLATTQRELQAAQVAIQERDYAISTQQRCEAALAAHAAQLNTTLAAASADISLLFDRVDAKNALEDGNLALVQQLRESAVARLSAVEQAITATAAAQAARFAEARTLLAGFLERKTADAARLQQQLGALQGQLDAIGTSAQAAAAVLQKAGTDGLQAIDTQQATYLTSAQAAAAEASSTIGAAYQALTASVAAEEQQLSALVQEQAAATQAVADATATIVSAVRSQLQQAKENAAATSSNLVRRLEAQAGAVSAFEEAFKASARAERTVLLQQIGDMLGSFVDKTGQGMAAAMAGLRSRIAEDQTSLQQQLGRMEAGTDASLAALATNEAAAQAAATSAAEGLQEGSVKLQQAIRASEQRVGAMQAAVHAAADAAAAGLQEHAAACHRLASKGTQALADLAGAEQEKARSAVAAGTQGRQALQEGIEADLKADESSASKLDGLAGTGAAAVAAFASEQAAAVAELSGSVQAVLGKQYQTDGSRDAVPAQRKRPVPAASEIAALRTPAVDQLFTAFHSEQQQPNNAVDGIEACTGEASDGEMQAQEQQQLPQQAGEEEQENKDAGNLAADLEVNVDLPAIKTGGGDQVMSPTLAGQKRGREQGGTPISARSPEKASKLRGAFEKHITTRGSRRG